MNSMLSKVSTMGIYSSTKNIESPPTVFVTSLQEYPTGDVIDDNMSFDTGGIDVVLDNLSTCFIQNDRSKFKTFRPFPGAKLSTIAGFNSKPKG